MRLIFFDTKTGIIENVVEVKDAKPEEGQALVDDDFYAGPGMIWDGRTATNTSVQRTFPSVSSRQLKLALYGANLLDAVENFVRQSNKIVQISWDSTSIFDRDDTLLNQMAKMFGLSDEDVDGLFCTASEL